jgi:hypothetical protein
MNEIEVPLKITGIGDIKKELRDLKGQIASATDPATIAALSQRAGELKDQLADTNEQVKIFASGSKFEQVSNGLGSIKDSLTSLDFAEAGDKAKMLTTTLKGINPEDIANQFKGLGKVFGSLGSAIGIVGKQFIAFGASLLANPIFLLVAVIVAIVAAIGIFLHKMGLLKKVLDFLFAPIKALIQGFKDLTDWLGLTAYAAEENAAKMVAANDRIVESSKDRQAAVGATFDFEIKMAKIAGKETTGLELEKSRSLQAESKKRYKSAQDALKAQQKLGDDADKEIIKKLKQQIKEEKALIIEQRRERKLIVAQSQKDKQDELEKDLEAEKKANEEKRKAGIDAAKKRAEDAKRFAENRLNAARAIRDIEISLIKDEGDREIVATQEKYARLIADVQKNENFTKDEKIKLQQLYQKQLEAELSKQEQTEIDAEKAKQAKLLEEYNNGLIKKAEEQDKQWLRLQELTSSQTDFEKLQLQLKYDQEIAAAEGNAELQTALTTKLQSDLNAIDKKNADERVKIKADEEAKKRQEQLDTANAAIDLADKSTKSIQAIGDIAFAAKMSKVKKGSKEEEELAKKQFKFNKSMQLAGAIVDAGKAVTASLASAPLAIGAVPNPAGIASLALAVTTSAANIAKIASTQFSSTGGGGGGGGQPSIPDASSTSTTGTATPAFNLFGGGNNMNNVGPDGQTQPTEITVKAVVSETEITNTQNKVTKINQSATL